MSPLGCHVICQLVDGRVIAPTPPERRILSRVVLEKSAAHRLLAFNAADTHLHMELREPERVSLEIARCIESSLHYRLDLPVGFAEAYPIPILKQRHLGNCFSYIMKQQPRHGLAWDPYHEASNLPDLLGLRLIGAHTVGNVRAFLPRVNRMQLLGYLGLPSLTPANGPLEQVVPAALAAVGLNDLVGRKREQAVARRAIMAVVDGHVPRTRLAEQIGVSSRTLQRNRELPVEQQLVQAIRLQLALRAAKPDHGQAPFED